MSRADKPLVWLHGEIRTPPFSERARLAAGHLLRCLQQGERLPMPQSRPMPRIGPRCHELRINDGVANWRIIYRVDNDAILILETFVKQTTKTPPKVIAACKARLRNYDHATK